MNTSLHTRILDLLWRIKDKRAILGCNDPQLNADAILLDCYKQIESLEAQVAKLTELNQEKKPHLFEMQLISTAPRDGTWFVGVATKPGWKHVRLVRFKNKDDCFPIDESNAMWDSEPTHWIPINNINRLNIK